jgi:two-component system, LytTR family, response regulator
MMNALIIEDDCNSLEVLKLLLNRDFSEINLLNPCTNAKDGKIAIQRFLPDLVFLDIELPDKTGFELLQEFDTIPFSIIFVSGHNHFAAEAFRWSALDYLVKPITAGLLAEAIEKSHQRRQLPHSSYQLQLLLDSLERTQRAKPLTKLALPTLSDIEFVNTTDIIRIEGEKNYSTFFLNDKRKITVSRNLGEFDKMLENSSFMRIQKSHLVNLAYVKKYIKADGGSVITSDGAEIPVSPTKRELLLSQMTMNSGW